MANARQFLAERTGAWGKSGGSPKPQKWAIYTYGSSEPESVDSPRRIFGYCDSNVMFVNNGDELYFENLSIPFTIKLSNTIENFYGETKGELNFTQKNVDSGDLLITTYGMCFWSIYYHMLVGNPRKASLPFSVIEGYDNNFNAVTHFVTVEPIF